MSRFIKIKPRFFSVGENKILEKGVGRTLATPIQTTVVGSTRRSTSRRVSVLFNKSRIPQNAFPEGVVVCRDGRGEVLLHLLNISLLLLLLLLMGSMGHGTSERKAYFGTGKSVEAIPLV